MCATREFGSHFARAHQSVTGRFKRDHRDLKIPHLGILLQCSDIIGDEIGRNRREHANLCSHPPRPLIQPLRQAGPLANELVGEKYRFMRQLWLKCSSAFQIVIGVRQTRYSNFSRAVEFDAGWHHTRFRRAPTGRGALSRRLSPARF